MSIQERYNERKQDTFLNPEEEEKQDRIIGGKRILTSVHEITMVEKKKLGKKKLNHIGDVNRLIYK